MKHEKIEVLCTSENYILEIGLRDDNLKQFKATLLAEIIKALDRGRISV